MASDRGRHVWADERDTIQIFLVCGAEAKFIGAVGLVSHGQLIKAAPGICAVLDALLVEPPEMASEEDGA